MLYIAGNRVTCIAKTLGPTVLGYFLYFEYASFTDIPEPNPRPSGRFRFVLPLEAAFEHPLIFQKCYLDYLTT